MRKLYVLLLALILVGCGAEATATSLPPVTSTPVAATSVATTQPTQQPTKPAATSTPSVKPTAASLLQVLTPEPTAQPTATVEFSPIAAVPLRLIVRKGGDVLIDTDPEDPEVGNPIAALGAAQIEGKYLPLTHDEWATWFKGYCGFNQACNQLIQAHAANKSKPFKRIGEIAVGDTAEVWTEDAIYTFEFTQSELIHWSNTKYIKREKGQHLLTLMTCDGNFTKVNGVLVADSRWMARAKLTNVKPR